MTDDPQSTTAWAVGARGEELLAERLDKLSSKGVLMLHDRRIPGSRANIDHLAVGPAGVFVIDAKHYSGRPRLDVAGGLFRARTEKLLIGSRDRTNLVAGLHRQVQLVQLPLAAHHFEVPVRGMLCFVEADWPLIGGAFTIAGCDVLGPTKAASRLLAPGPLTNEEIRQVHRDLAEAFRQA